MDVYGFFENYNAEKNFEVSLLDVNSGEEICTTVDQIQSNEKTYRSYDILEWGISSNNVINFTVEEDITYSKEYMTLDPSKNIYDFLEFEI